MEQVQEAAHRQARAVKQQQKERLAAVHRQRVEDHTPATGALTWATAAFGIMATVLLIATFVAPWPTSGLTCIAAVGFMVTSAVYSAAHHVGREVNRWGNALANRRD